MQCVDTRGGMDAGCKVEGLNRSTRLLTLVISLCSKQPGRTAAANQTFLHKRRSKQKGPLQGDLRSQRRPQQQRKPRGRTRQRCVAPSCGAWQYSFSKKRWATPDPVTDIGSGCVFFIRIVCFAVCGPPENAATQRTKMYQSGKSPRQICSDIV